MQNNYFFLKQLSVSLSKILIGKSIVQCFSQTKNELIIELADNHSSEHSFYIQASVNPNFPCLNFPKNYSRANNNSIDIFENIIGKSVISIFQHETERAFSINLSDHFHLTFKMFGNKSNIILFKGNHVQSIFQTNLKSDKGLIYNQINRKLDISFTSFSENQFNLQKTIPTLGNELVSHFQLKYHELNPNINFDAVHFFNFVLDQIINLNNSEFYIISKNEVPALSLIPAEEIIEKFDNPIEAITKFYYLFSKTNGLIFKKNRVNAEISNMIIKLRKSVFEITKRLSKYDSEIKNEQIANIIMANIHQIPANIDTIILFDFYHEKDIAVKLKKDLSPQENAENYYRKSKNESIEIDLLIKTKVEKEEKILHLSNLLNLIPEISDIKNFRKFLKDNNLEKNIQTNNPEEPPFKLVEFDGFQIFIGKNANNNDVLTTKFAKKDDLWLHARDVAGSHVLIRNQAGKKFPKNVIERAAQLAAYHSKRRTDTVCPVIVTPKKFVRKAKNMAAGKVIIDKEETLLVQPIG